MQHARFAQVQDGILEGASQIVSPNFNARPADTEIQLIVIHKWSERVETTQFAKTEVLVEQKPVKQEKDLDQA